MGRVSRRAGKVYYSFCTSFWNKNIKLCLLKLLSWNLLFVFWHVTIKFWGLIGTLPSTAVVTVEPWFNKPPCSFSVWQTIFFLPVIVKCIAKNLDIHVTRHHPFNLPCTYVCASKLKRECDIGSGVLSWNCLDGGCCVVVNNCFILIGLNLSFATTCRKPFCFKKPARLDWFKAEGSSRKSNQRCSKRR